VVQGDGWSPDVVRRTAAGEDEFAGMRQDYPGNHRRGSWNSGKPSTTWPAACERNFTARGGAPHPSRQGSRFRAGGFDFQVRPTRFERSQSPSSSTRRSRAGAARWKARPLSGTTALRWSLVERRRRTGRAPIRRIDARRGYQNNASWLGWLAVRARNMGPTTRRERPHGGALPSGARADEPPDVARPPTCTVTRQSSSRLFDPPDFEAAEPERGRQFPRSFEDEYSAAHTESSQRRHRFVGPPSSKGGLRFADDLRRRLRLRLSRPALRSDLAYARAP